MRSRCAGADRPDAWPAMQVIPSCIRGRRRWVVGHDFAVTSQQSEVALGDHPRNTHEKRPGTGRWVSIPEEVKSHAQVQVDRERRIDKARLADPKPPRERL